MNRSFPLAFAELKQFEFGTALRNVDFRPVIPLTAFFTFEPGVFSFFILGHFSSALYL